MSNFCKINLFLILLLPLIPLFADEFALESDWELSEEEKEFLLKKGTLMVMFDDDFSPISYYNEEASRYEGVSVDVLERLSTILDFSYEIMRDTSLDWSAKLEKIKNNEIDILGSASKNNARKEYGSFVPTPYFKVNYALIKLVDHHVFIGKMEDLNSVNLGLSKGISINDYILSYLLDTTNVIYYENKDEALNALQRREIDVYPYNEAVFKEDFFKGSLFDYEIAYSIKDVQKEYAYFIPQTEEGKILTSILEKGMSQINTDKIIADRYQNKSSFAFYKNYLEELQLKNNIKTIALVFSGALFLSILIISIILKSQSSQKQRMIMQLESLKKELERKASHDSLTNLPNRTLFSDRIEQAILRSRRNKSKFAVLFMDLDGFKTINDVFGHNKGDKVLIEVAAILSQCIRGADTLARMGGDEFICLLPEIPDEKHPIVVAERIIKSFSNSIYVDKEKCKLGISIGISIYPDHSEDSETLIILADNAMYRVKSEGKNNYRYAKV